MTSDRERTLEEALRSFLEWADNPLPAHCPYCYVPESWEATTEHLAECPFEKARALASPAQEPAPSAEAEGVPTKDDARRSLTLLREHLSNATPGTMEHEDYLSRISFLEQMLQLPDDPNSARTASIELLARHTFERMGCIADDEKCIAILAAALRRYAGDAWQVKAAEWHDERAKGLRNIAATTRRDWTDPAHYSEDDRRANHADAREHDQRAYWHEQCRDALAAARAKSGASHD